MSKVIDAFDQTLNLCNEAKEKAIVKEEFHVAAQFRDLADDIKRLKKEAEKTLEPCDKFITIEECMESLFKTKGKQMNFHNLPKREAENFILRHPNKNLEVIKT